MDIFAKKTHVIIGVFAAIIAASFAIAPNVYADTTSSPLATPDEELGIVLTPNPSFSSTPNDLNKTATFSLPEIVDGKYSFGETVFDNMKDDEIDALVGDLPRGHWEYVDVQKTRKGAVLKDGKVQVAEIPYTVKVRTAYVLEDYLISYNNLIEGSSAPETKTFKYDTPTFDLQPANDTEDWLFEGWYTGENGTGTRVTQITQHTKADVTLYANYIPNFYIVRFSANGGDGVVNDIKVKRDIEVTLPVSPMKKSGYKFIGWNTNPDRTGDMLVDQACINNLTAGNDIALYAQYDPITYMVSFNANGGTGTMQTQGILYDASKNLMSSVMKKDGMRFCGWNTEENGSGEWYADASVVRNLTKTENKVVTLYAQYEDPASPNPFANMTGTVFVGNTVYEDFNPMTTSYNLEGMPQQISISNAPANFAVESIETSDIISVEGTNTVEKSQQTAVKVRYYGTGESQERIYKFNWEWIESMGSSFGKEITTVPVFKHGTSYPAGSYLVGSDIDSGSYIIEYEGNNTTSISLSKKGSGTSSAMKSGRSYDLADGDKIEAEIPFYLILEFDTTSIKNSEIANSVIQEANEASLRGNGIYVEVDPIQKVIPPVINEPTYDLTSPEGMVNNSNTVQKKTPVTNDVIEEVKKEDTPEYIQNEIDARTSTTYEIVDTNTTKENNTGDVATNDVRLEDYYGTWKFESFTTDTQEDIEKAERGDLVPPKYSDLTYSYSDDNKDNIRTIDDFIAADNQIEIKQSGTAIQRFKYADDDTEYTSYAEWEKIENNGKIEGIRISAIESDYEVTATIMSGKLVFDKTCSYAAIFKKIAEPKPSPQPSSSSDNDVMALGTQSFNPTNSFGFISPYSVFSYVWKEIQQTVDPDPKTNTNTNTESGVIAPITVTEPGSKTNSAGPGIKNTNDNNNPRPAEPSTDTDTPKPSTDKENGNSGNDTPGTSIETQSPSSPNPQPDGTWQAINSNSGSPAQTPIDQTPSVNVSPSQTHSFETTKVEGGTQTQPSSQPRSVTSNATVSAPIFNAPVVTPDKVINNSDGTKTEVTTGNDGTVTYTKVEPDGDKTTWVVDVDVVPDNLLPTNADITTKFEEIAQGVDGMSSDTIKIISDNLKRSLDNTGEGLSNGVVNVAISNAVESAKRNGLISDDQARVLKSNAKKGNDELFKETEERAIRNFVESLPEGGTEDGEVLTTENGEFVPMPRELRPNGIENSYQNYNAANAPEITPRNNAANKNMQVKDESAGALDNEGIIAQIASNEVLRAGVVGLPVLIIVLIAAFMFTRSDERE